MRKLGSLNEKKCVPSQYIVWKLYFSLLGQFRSTPHGINFKRIKKKRNSWAVLFSARFDAIKKGPGDSHKRFGDETVAGCRT